jgi:hypothetical protein
MVEELNKRVKYFPVYLRLFLKHPYDGRLGARHQAYVAGAHVLAVLALFLSPLTKKAHGRIGECSSLFSRLTICVGLKRAEVRRALDLINRDRAMIPATVS